MPPCQGHPRQQPGAQERPRSAAASAKSAHAEALALEESIRRAVALQNGEASLPPEAGPARALLPPGQRLSDVGEATAGTRKCNNQFF